jgi:hypothetical protein
LNYILEDHEQCDDQMFYTHNIEHINDYKNHDLLKKCCLLPQVIPYTFEKWSKINKFKMFDLIGTWNQFDTKLILMVINVFVYD